MKHSSQHGKLLAFETLLIGDDEADEALYAAQDAAKHQWLRHSPAVLAHRIPTSVFALGDLARTPPPGD